jgi:hypothetical protein
MLHEECVRFKVLHFYRVIIINKNEKSGTLQLVLFCMSISNNTKLIAMRFSFLLAVLFTQLTGMAQTARDSIALTNLLKDDYVTMQTIDFERHRSNCSPNYLLIENGAMLTLDQEKDWYDKRKGKKIDRTDNFIFRYLKIDGNTAYTVYNLKSVITEDGQTKNKNWNESVIFKKINGHWKIELIHSTPVPNKLDKITPLPQARN